VVVVVVLVVAAALLEREESASGVTGVEVGEPHPARAAAHTTARNVGAAPRTGTSEDRARATQDRRRAS
jgi:hypothetical protein